MLLHLQQKPLFIFLLSFTIWSWWTLDGVVSDPQLSYVKSGCSSYNVSDVTIFNENLNTTMRSLRAQISNQSKHSATAQAVKGNNPAYGVFQCRNYLSIKDCLACFDIAAVQIYNNCSVAATGARLIYEGCFLRYESSFFYDQSVDGGNHLMCGNRVVKNSTELASTVQQVLKNLELATPRIPGYFAATITQVPNSNGSNIYAFAQCLETLTQSGCQDCLESGLRNFQICLPNSNAKIFYAGCFMRYSTTAFFAANQTTDLKNILKQGGSTKKKAIIGGAVGGASFILILFALLALYRRSLSKRVHRVDVLGATELKGPVNYRYKDLKSATKNFSEENKLGEGGFGDVYKGTLKNGKVIAIKKLALEQSKKMDEDFESEVKLISNVHHRNLVRLLGCCSKGKERFLVYEYMRNNNVGQFLFDFGLARLLPSDQSHLNTKFAGTMGYTAPEYIMHGQLSEKVDTYCYGVVILEIMSGQKSGELKDDDREFLLQRAWKLYDREMHIEFVDKTLDASEYDAEEVKKIIEIGLLCTQASPASRPTMCEVVDMLESKDGLMDHKRPTMPVYVDPNLRPTRDISQSSSSSLSNATDSTSMPSGR
ncbi:cysteine-rich receptor-like protein kinase 2 isoform X3 [Prosopis cineraria]|uniref:cysteine-rich receptor-like protein kinase 2 isoform X3 n=1 Tax=Prosopis cineraria TaxID=364024 RepID=UPI00240EA370|nr:cysteine-rich receptor-like protein kinase 2 isoform X3 [Prosopis cineraria]